MQKNPSFSLDWWGSVFLEQEFCVDAVGIFVLRVAGCYDISFDDGNVDCDGEHFCGWFLSRKKPQLDQ